MKLSDAVTIQMAKEKDEDCDQYIIFSKSCALKFLCPIYNSVEGHIVIDKFIDTDLKFYKVSKKMLKADDWKIIKVKDTILNDVTDAHNVITLPVGDDKIAFCHFSMINVLDFFNRE
ncbi:MAG TPA: hypothetical protein PLM63_02045 [bacterium]|nr:hypothetical protein [bacterium]HPO11339.1 hypothetical protein [bacterium]HQL11909.1 hypothetical protein [bacterium]